jgi:hypothetical protein
MLLRDAVPYRACSGCHLLVGDVLAFTTPLGRVGERLTRLVGADSTPGAPGSEAVDALLDRATAGTAAIIAAVTPIAIVLASSGLRIDFVVRINPVWQSARVGWLSGDNYSVTTALNVDPATAAQTYFAAWADKDFDRLRSVLSDDATFRGPLGKADSGDDCLEGLRRMAEMITKLNVLKSFVNGPDVVTWFDLYVSDEIPIPTANWMHVEDGKIARIRVTFDPREILKATDSSN